MIFNTVKVKDIGKVVGGGTPSTSNPDYYGGDIPWLSPKDLTGYSERYISRGATNITQCGYDNSSAKLMPKGTVLMSSRAPIGYLAIAKNDICTNQGFKSIVPDSSIIDSEFLYYLLKNNVTEIQSLGVGTTFAEISGKVFEEFEIHVPPLQYQKKVAHVLSTIDQRIELNAQINRNLADICQTEFDKLYKSSNSTVQLSELAEVCYGKDHKCLNDGPFPVYGSGGIMRFAERPLYDGKESVLIPRKGSLNNIMFISEPFWSVDTMFYTKMKNPHVAKYLYYYLKKQDLASMNAGSAVPSMTTDILNEMDVPIPDDSSLVLFDDRLGPMFEIMHHNNKENTKMTQLRDYLLPKLMSGEIDVSKLEITN